jgi:hypothetical protein
MFIITNNCNPEYFNQNAIIDTRHVFLCLHWLHSAFLVFKKIRRIWSGIVCEDVYLVQFGTTLPN